MEVSLNNSSFKDGFRETPIINAPKTVPIPTPAPASPIVASPAPINLAACNNNIIKIKYLYFYTEIFKLSFKYFV